MGYESSGYGTFKVRDLYDPDFTIEQLQEEHWFEVAYSKDKEFTVGFNGGRVYNMDEEFLYLLETCNGEIEIQGELPDDLWIMRFKDGKVSRANSIISFSDFEEMTLDEAI